MKETREYNDGLLWMVEDEDATLIGVTQAGLDKVGAVTDLDLAEAGDEFDSGDWIGEIQGKDYVLEIVAPFDLTLIEVNPELAPSQLEDDPTGDGWIIRVEKREN